MTKKAVAGLFFFGLVGAIVIGPAIIWLDGHDDGMAWIGTMLFVIIAVAAIGEAISDRFDGVFIDSRNRVSLARVQAALWTLFVLSAVAVAGERNLYEFMSGSPSPKPAVAAGAGPSAQAGTIAPIATDSLAFKIPPELLAVMGIAGFSLVAAPAALSQKTKQAAPAVVPQIAGAAPPQGRLFVRVAASTASWSDLFVGDDVSNVASTDLSKIQQFTVTAILVGVYACGLWGMFSLNRRVDNLPALSQQFVWLLGISHASYLAAKTVPGA